MVGFPKPKNIQLEIHGFYLIDRRRKPHVAIFKNCEIVMDDKIKPVLKEEPKPFQYVGEAMAHKKSMHLSSNDDALVKPVALVPDPGMGAPKPDVMWIEKKEAKDR